MKKVAIVGVEGSGKTVMLAGLGDLYSRPDGNGYFLAPKDFRTAEYVAEKIERMREGKWPVATAGDELQGLEWTLKRRVPGARKPPEKICEVSFLDFAGEVYRAAFGIGEDDSTLAAQVDELKRYVREADDLIVLINLRDVIAGVRDQRVKEAKWITKAILDVALSEEEGRKTPRAAIVLSQADSYAETIKECGNALGVLDKYLPYVAAEYGWLDVFAANAVDKTVLDDDGNIVPATDFTMQGLLPILKWICGGEVLSGGGPGATAQPGNATAEGKRLSRSDDKTGGMSDEAKAVKRVQLWKGGPYWADRNVGAEKPWESGYYFWWGDTVGYRREGDVWVASDGTSSNFSFSGANIPTCNKSIEELKREGWIAAHNVLTPEHDAAQVQWGGGWRMPERQELEYLRSKCDWRWTRMNGVGGYIVRGRGGYASNSIFLPCAGLGCRTSLRYAGSDGYYWSSVLTSDNNDAWYFSFFSSDHDASCSCRLYGQSVRPVQRFTK